MDFIVITTPGVRGLPGVPDGDVSGPDVSVDGALALFSGITGKLLAASGIKVSADDEMSGHGAKVRVYDADHILAAADAGCILEAELEGDLVFTVPPQTDVEWKPGAQFGFASKSLSGVVSIAAGAGVTINSPGGKLNLSMQFSQAYMYRTGEDEWMLAGDLAA